MYLKKLKELEQKIFTAPYRWLLKKGLIVAEKVYLTLYYLSGSYTYSNGKINNEYQARVSNIWLYENGGFKLYYKNFNKLKKGLKPMDIIAYPMD